MAKLFLIMFFSFNVHAQFFNNDGAGIEKEINQLQSLTPNTQSEFEQSYIQKIQMIEAQFHLEEEKCASLDKPVRPDCFKEVIRLRKKYIELSFNLKLKYTEVIWEDKRKSLQRAKLEQIKNLEKLYE